MDYRFLGKSLLAMGMTCIAAAPFASADPVPPPIPQPIPRPIAPRPAVPAPIPQPIPKPIPQPVAPRRVVPPPPIPRPVVVREPVEVTEVVVVEKTTSNARLLSGGEFMKLNDLPGQAEILTSPGREIVFAIEENATTGYSWVVGGSVENSAVAVAVSHNGPTNTNLDGAPGNASFRVSAKAVGQAVLLLQYKRPNEDKAAASIALRVVVQ